MPEIQHILKRTIHEEYEYDPAKLREQFGEEFIAFAEERRNWKRSDGSFYSLGEKWEWFVTEKFEQHEGSAYGDELFGQIDVDAGIVLFTRSEDD